MEATVAHHFDDAQQQYTAAELGMWVFLATEILFFGGMFAGYAVYRGYYSAAFSAGSHTLDLVLGTINTGILLGSSLTMALAVHAAQTGATRRIVTFLTATLVLGAAFLGIKGYEYFEKVDHDHFPNETFEFVAHGTASSPHGGTSTGANEADVDPDHVRIFFSFYFAMTGLHAVHMIIGGGLILWLILLARRGRFSPEYATPVEMVGLYWHFVDIVWVYLFPLLYLIR